VDDFGSLLGLVKWGFFRGMLGGRTDAPVVFDSQNAVWGFVSGGSIGLGLSTNNFLEDYGFGGVFAMLRDAVAGAWLN
jgi:hypothetical protein